MIYGLLVATHILVEAAAYTAAIEGMGSTDIMFDVKLAEEPTR